MNAASVFVMQDAPLTSTETIPSDNSENPTDAPAPSEARTLAAFHEILTGLARTATRSHEETDRNQILTLLTQKACALTDCESAAIVLLDAARETVRFAAAWGENAREIIGSEVRANDTLAGNTARTGEPYWAFRDAFPQGMETPGAARTERITSAAVLPIFVGGVSVGAIAALHKKNHLPFDGADLMRLAALASAAGLAIGTHAQQAEREQQKRELGVLYEAVQNVSSALSVPDVLRVVVEQVAAQMESSAVVVWLLSEGRTHLSIAEDEGLTPDEREVILPLEKNAPDTAWTARVLEQNKAVFLQFADEDAAFPPPPTNAPHDGICQSPFPALSARAGLACAIRAGDTVRGMVLVLSQQKSGVYQKSDARLLAALCSQAAVALENADLYENANRRADEASVLYQLSQTAAASLPLPHVLSAVADAALSLLSADAVALFLHDKPTDTLQIVCGRNLPDGMEPFAPQVGQGIAGWVMEFETPAAVQNVAGDVRNHSAPMDFRIASLLAMPLQIGSETIGVLCALSFLPRHFTVGETELAYTLANQAAVATENARVYQAVQKTQAATRRFFVQTGRALAASSDPDKAQALMVSLPMEVFHADRCALFFVPKGRDAVLRQAAFCGFPVVSTPSAAQGETQETTPAQWVAQNNAPLAIENVNTDDRFVRTYARPVRGGASGYLGVPLRYGGRVIGVLEVMTRRRKRWEQNETRLLQGFAAQIAGAFWEAQIAQEAACRAARARCLERLQAARTGKNGADLTGDFAGVVAALALGLNAPCAVLVRDGKQGKQGKQGERGASWKIAASSVPNDDVPLDALQAALAFPVQTGAPSGIMTAVSAKVAVAVWGAGGEPGEPGEPGERQTLLDAALSVLAAAKPAAQFVETVTETVVETVETT